MARKIPSDSHNYNDENRDEIELYLGIVTGAPDDIQH